MGQEGGKGEIGKMGEAILRMFRKMAGERMEPISGPTSNVILLLNFYP